MLQEKDALRGKSAITGLWSAISVTSAVLAKVIGLLARLFQSITNGLEWLARWTNSKATGVPITPLGADLAGDDWEEPVLLPLAPEPPPIPPSAFFKAEPTPAEEAEWKVALAAAKQDPEPETDEWTNALRVAKSGTHPVVTEEQAAALAPAAVVVNPTAPAKAAPVAAKEPEVKKATTPAPALRPSTPLPVRRTAEVSTPTPARRTAELRVGPKAAAPRAAESRIITMKSTPTVAQPTELGSRSSSARSVVDPHVAAATKKAIAATLRT